MIKKYIGSARANGKRINVKICAIGARLWIKNIANPDGAWTEVVLKMPATEWLKAAKAEQANYKDSPLPALAESALIVKHAIRTAMQC